MIWWRCSKKQVSVIQGRPYRVGKTIDIPPPIENPGFRQALANIFRLSEKGLVEIAFHLNQSSERTEEIERAVSLVESMDDEKRKIALLMLEVLADPYKRHGIERKSTK